MNCSSSNWKPKFGFRGYNPISPFIRTFIGIISPFITGRGPPCRKPSWVTPRNREVHHRWWRSLVCWQPKPHILLMLQKSQTTNHRLDGAKTRRFNDGINEKKLNCQLKHVFICLRNHEFYSIVILKAEHTKKEKKTIAQHEMTIHCHCG